MPGHRLQTIIANCVSATAPLPPLRSVKVLDQLRERMRSCITAYQPNRLMSTGFVPSSVPRCVRHPAATLGSSEVEAFLSAQRQRKVSISTHRPRHWRPCLLLLQQGAVLDLPRLQGDRKTSASALAVVRPGRDGLSVVSESVCLL